MNELRCPVAVRLLKLADGQQSDPVVAYLLAWSALEHVSCVVGEATGLRARFALHQNGVLRVRKEGGHKMPEIVLPRHEDLLNRALKSVAPDACRDLILHPATRYLAGRIPLLDGRPVVSDAYRQHPRGVLDVGSTLDPRYPVWSFVDANALRRYAGGERSPELSNRLLEQIAEVLATIHRNLLGTCQEAKGENDTELAARALPLLVALVKALMDVGASAVSEEVQC